MKYALFFYTALSTAFGLAQQSQKQIINTDGTSFLLGEIDRNDLETTAFTSWFVHNYEQYTVDEQLIKLFQRKLRHHEIVLFLGTWCGDSKRQVPRMLKILDAAKFPEDQLRLIALDRRKETYKQGPNGEEKGWNIKRVPTLILLKKGKEVNRIIERPVDTLEEDLLAILSQMEYTPNYSF